MLDPLVEKAPDTLQEFNARVAEVVARGFWPAAFQKRQCSGAEETSVLMLFGRGGGIGGIFFFHISSPSFPR
jgi:hypothetical protein